MGHWAAGSVRLGECERCQITHRDPETVTAKAGLAPRVILVLDILVIDLVDTPRSGRGYLVLTPGFRSRHLCSGGHNLTHCIKSLAATILLYRNNM